MKSDPLACPHGITELGGACVSYCHELPRQDHENGLVQRHVVDRQLAERMFGHKKPPTLSLELAGEAPCDKCVNDPVTWLVGPIKCERCDGTGRYTGNFGTAKHLPCPPCDGLGYPPTVEIVSEMEVHPGNEPYAVVHGVVKLGKPVPIVGMSQANADDYTEDVFILAPVGNGTRPVRVDRTAGVEYVMSNIGPCSPGDVAYPIEVAS